MNIIGRLTRDAEVRTTPQDKKVVNFTIAIDESYRNQQGERIKQTCYFDCAYWITPKVAQYLTKGTLVELTGRVFSRAWKDKDGNVHSGLNFNTSKIKFHERSSRNDDEQPQPIVIADNTEAAQFQSVADDLPF